MGDLWHFIRQTRRYWLVPVLALILVVGLLIVLAESSALGPILYPLF